MKKRLFALLCAVVLCCSMVPVRAINVGDVYFVAVNDRLCPLTMATMPTWVNGMLYVPASVFDSAEMEVDLGVYQSYNRDNNSLTVYSLRKMLVLDLSRGTAYDQHSGESVPIRAVTRNAKTYLPVDAMSDFFGLEDTYHYTQYGYLVRIKSDAAWLTDAVFIDAASDPMASSLQQLINQQQGESTTKPEVETPTMPQKPTTMPEVPTTPQKPSTPTQEPTPPEQEKKSAQICLAVRCETGEGLTSILNLLEQKNYRGIFFVGAEMLTEYDDLIRRILGSGHSIGLLTDGQTADESRQQLQQANRTLEHVARTAATAAMVPEEQREELEQEEWVCWQETVNGLPREKERAYTYAQRIIRGIGTRRSTVCLTLDDSQRTADLLPTLFRQMERQGYTIIIPLETKL